MISRFKIKYKKHRLGRFLFIPRRSMFSFVSKSVSKTFLVPKNTKTITQDLIHTAIHAEIDPIVLRMLKETIVQVSNQFKHWSTNISDKDILLHMSKALHGSDPRNVNRVTQHSIEAILRRRLISKDAYNDVFRDNQIQTKNLFKGWNDQEYVDHSVIFNRLQAPLLLANLPPNTEITLLETPYVKIPSNVPEDIQKQLTNCKFDTGNTIADAYLCGRFYDFKIVKDFFHCSNHIYVLDASAKAFKKFKRFLFHTTENPEVPEKIRGIADDLYKRIERMNPEESYLVDLVNTWNRNALDTCKRYSLVKLPVFVSIPETLAPNPQYDSDVLHIELPPGHITYEKVAIALKTYIMHKYPEPVLQAIQLGTNNGLLFDAIYDTHS